MSLAAAFVIVGWFYCAEPPDAVKQEMTKLEGEFTMVSGERDGQPVPDVYIKTGKRESKDGETTITVNGQLFMKAKYTVDPSKKPKTIDYTVTNDGPQKGKTVLGIYEADGDSVKFCFSQPGQERPKDFTAKAGSGQTVSVWKRVKK